MKMMKTLSVVGALVFSANAFAASTGQLLLSGVIANKIYLSMTSNGPDASVDQTLNVDSIVNGTETSKTFANIFYEVSNAAGGYKIFLTSANGGELRGTGNNKVKYTLDYSSAKINIAACNFAVVSSCVNGSGAQTARSSSAATLVVKATSTAAEIAALTAGTYTDTVTVSISAQ